MIPFWTLSGTIDLTDLQPENLTAEVIGDALAKLNRFSGRTREPWSVAAHSVLVERLCAPDLGPWALLHDGHEIFIGDMTPPAIELVASTARIPDLDDAIAAVKGRLDRVIASAWRIVPRSLNAEVRHADRIALQAEAMVFLNTTPVLVSPGDEDDIDRAISLIREMPHGPDWRLARDLWLSRVEHYTRRGLMAPPRETDPTAPAA